MRGGITDFVSEYLYHHLYCLKIRGIEELLLNRELRNRGSLNRELLNRESINRESLNSELLNRGSLNRELPNRG